MDSTSGTYVLKRDAENWIAGKIEFEVGFLKQACTGLATNYWTRVSYFVIGANRRDKSPLVRVAIL